MLTKTRILACLLTGAMLGTANADIVFRTTHYQPTKKQCGNTRGITASTLKLAKGHAASNWRDLPPGTVIEFQTKNKPVVVITDRGDMKKNFRYRGVGVKYQVDLYTPGARVCPEVSRGRILRMGNRRWYASRGGARRSALNGLSFRKAYLKARGVTVPKTKTHRIVRRSKVEKHNYNVIVDHTNPCRPEIIQNATADKKTTMQQPSMIILDNKTSPNGKVAYRCPICGFETINHDEAVGHRHNPIITDDDGEYE